MIRNPFRDIDQRKLRRSSDLLQTQNDYFKIVNHRIYVFSILIIVIFMIIAFRLLFLQVREQETYAAKLASVTSQKQRFQTPRGEMYDREGNLIVKTASAHNIIYVPQDGVTTDEKWELAHKFAKQFDLKGETLNQSDMQDLYLFLYRDENGKADPSGSHLLTKKEQETLTPKEANTIVRSRITEDMVNKLATKEDKEAFVVYLAMNRAPAYSTKVIVEDASNTDVAYLMEHKEDFPNFDVDFSSWKREYPYKDTFRDVLGSVTSTKQGLPMEDREYYEAMGYSITDRVGSSGLEKQYEQLLSGTPKINEVIYEKDGTRTIDESKSGKKGYDLHLTIDMELQEKTDAIIEDVLKRYGGKRGREAFKQAFVILINPNSGEILTMSGAMKTDDNDIIKFASGNYLSNFQVGSVVKGATVYMALNEGVQTATSIVVDEPMNIAGEMKSSFNNYGPINAVDALKVSSNVYMWKSVIKLAGGDYVYGKSLNITPEAAEATLTLMRQYYSMFGLGTYTGLDVPNEALGIIGYIQNVGNLLDYSIGQFDTYSPIQLAQYVSTIANGGKKITPKLVNSATEVNSDYVVYENKSEVQSQIAGNTNHLKTVRDGFRACITANRCGVELNTMDKGIAAKTGTAQVRETIKGKTQYLTNALEIGFAPYDKPEIAFVCVAPTSSSDTAALEANICSTEILPRVLKEYFKKYK